jgi:hypothetical protein
MAEDDRTRPELDALIEARDAEHAVVRDLRVIGMAESTVAGARHAELVALHTQAFQRGQDADANLDRALAGGDPVTIARARSAAQDAHADFEDVSPGLIEEMQQIVRAQLDRMGEFNTQMLRSFDASTAVFDVCTRPRSPQLPSEDQ